MLPTYRNQSIDLHNKSIDWFLYEVNTGNEWVKRKMINIEKIRFTPSNWKFQNKHF